MRRRRALPAILALATALLMAAGSAGRAAAEEAWSDEGYKLAQGARAWRFPADHGQHPAYRLEWWYYTGIVRTAAGRRFGYQVTFFRRGLRPDPPRRASVWATWSLYSVHAAVSDLEAGRYLHEGRSGRDGLGLAGASPERHEVWLGDWRAEPLADDPHGVALRLDTEGFALALELRAPGPPVLHGDGGLDRKAAEEGAASWYYSMPRLRTTGTLTVEGTPHAVEGRTWMDHEFSSTQLGENQVGWDWMGLRLSDGSALMLYRLRRRDGGTDPFSGGTWVAPDGTAHPIALGAESAARMMPQEWWTSEATGARYPVAWRVRLPEQGLRLHVAAAMPQQELAPTAGVPFAYWEGVVDVEGTRAGTPVTGEGYLELTGYGGGLGGTLR